MIEVELRDTHLLPTLSGVYAITNTLNNKRYIGSSMNIHQRLANHRSKLRSGKHHNTMLLNAYNKYGEDKFKVQILETCDKIRSTLMFLEQKYLDLKPEYNISPLANRPDRTGRKCSEKTKQLLRQQRLGKKLSEETKLKISNAGKDKTIKTLYVYNLDGQYIGRFCSLKAALKGLKIKENGSSIYCAVSKNCKNSISRYAYGYLWSRYKYDSLPPYKRNTSCGKEVVQIDLNDNIVQQFSSVKEAARKLGNENGRFWIKECISGKRPTAFNYKWKYKK